MPTTLTPARIVGRDMGKSKISSNYLKYIGSLRRWSPPNQPSRKYCPTMRLTVPLSANMTATVNRAVVMAYLSQELIGVNASGDEDR
jgi:hypothetical protein